MTDPRMARPTGENPSFTSLIVETLTTLGWTREAVHEMRADDVVALLALEAELRSKA